MRILSTLVLLFALVAASIACAAITSTPTAPQHPCCPQSKHPGSDGCAKIDCIGTAAALVSNSVTLPAPELGILHSHTAEEAPPPEWINQPALLCPPDFTLFLTHHQLLI